MSKKKVKDVYTYLPASFSYYKIRDKFEHTNLKGEIIAYENYLGYNKIDVLYLMVNQDGLVCGVIGLADGYLITLINNDYLHYIYEGDFYSTKKPKT